MFKKSLSSSSLGALFRNLLGVHLFEEKNTGVGGVKKNGGGWGVGGVGERANYRRTEVKLLPLPVLLFKYNTKLHHLFLINSLSYKVLRPLLIVVCDTCLDRMGTEANITL